MTISRFPSRHQNVGRTSKRSYWGWSIVICVKLGRRLFRILGTQRWWRDCRRTWTTCPTSFPPRSNTSLCRDFFVLIPHYSTFKADVFCLKVVILIRGNVRNVTREFGNTKKERSSSCFMFYWLKVNVGRSSVCRAYETKMPICCVRYISAGLNYGGAWMF